MSFYRVMNFVILFTFCCSAANAWQIATGNFDTWKKSLEVKQTVVFNLNQFFRSKSLDSRDFQKYAAEFPKIMKERVFSESETLLTEAKVTSDECTKIAKIQFPKKVSESKLFSQDKLVEIFESEILRVETLDCLGAVDLEKVFQVFMSADFQKKSISGLLSVVIDPEINQVCQKTHILGLGTSDYCFTQDIWRNNDTIVIHSFNETNKATASAPVYFREVLTVMQKNKDDKISIYNLAYGRGPDLPFHALVKNIVSKQQVRLIEQLIQASGL